MTTHHIIVSNLSFHKSTLERLTEGVHSEEKIYQKRKADILVYKREINDLKNNRSKIAQPKYQKSIKIEEDRLNTIIFSLTFSKCFLERKRSDLSNFRSKARALLSRNNIIEANNNGDVCDLINRISELL